jgi:hypothetical protein
MVDKKASVETLGLSQRALKVLKDADITTFEQLDNDKNYNKNLK